MGPPHLKGGEPLGLRGQQLDVALDVQAEDGLVTRVQLGVAGVLARGRAAPHLVADRVAGSLFHLGDGGAVGRAPPLDDGAADEDGLDDVEEERGLVTDGDDVSSA